MPTVIAHHNVKDRDQWLTSSKREEVFGPLGVTNIRTFVDPKNPTRVACRAGQLLGQSGPADARTRGHAYEPGAQIAPRLSGRTGGG